VLVLLFNIENLALDVLLAVGLGWGVAGVAWGTVLSEWTAALLGGAVLWHQLRLGGKDERARYAAIFWDPNAWRRLVAISRDLLVRTFFVQLPFLVNTLLAASLGSLVLAGNAILMQFFFIVTYALDGFAHTAEALTGYAVGAKSRIDVQKTTRYCGVSALIFALGLTVLLVLFPVELISQMTNLPDVTASALRYYPWICVLPLAGVWAFLFDGVFIGATRIRELRNAMFVAAGLYLLVIAGLFEYLGNTALWLGLTVFMLARAILLGLRYPRLLHSIETDNHPSQASVQS
jgi:MATE family multidrug resistance protein